MTILLPPWLELLGAENEKVLIMSLDSCMTAIFLAPRRSSKHNRNSANGPRCTNDILVKVAIRAMSYFL